MTDHTDIRRIDLTITIKEFPTAQTPEDFAPDPVNTRYVKLSQSFIEPCAVELRDTFNDALAALGFNV